MKVKFFRYTQDNKRFRSRMYRVVYSVTQINFYPVNLCEHNQELNKENKMEIKYVVVFGDQGIFDKAPKEATHATQGGGFYKVNDDGLMEYLSNGVMNGNKNETLTAYLIAERRIIAEPKRWTVEDKKAGRLPEVGAIVVSDGFNEKCEFLGVGMVNGFFVVRLPNGLISINSASSFSPIETPEEKAQREEDEFVSLVESKYNKMPNEISFKAGIRAAYRKLKGGE